MRTITLTPDAEIRLAFSYDRAIVRALRETFELLNYQPQQRVWLLPPTQKNLTALPQFQRQYAFQLRGRLESQQRMMTRFREARIAASLATDAPALHLPGLRGQLRPFQRAGVAYMVRTRRCLVADEMGWAKPWKPWLP